MYLYYEIYIRKLTTCHAGKIWVFWHLLLRLAIVDECNLRSFDEVIYKASISPLNFLRKFPLSNQIIKSTFIAIYK